MRGGNLTFNHTVVTLAIGDNQNPYDIAIDGRLLSMDHAKYSRCSD
jgi:hypothetical protein